MLVYKQIQLYKHVLIVLKYIIKCLGFSADKNRQLNTLYYMTLIKNKGQRTGQNNWAFALMLCFQALNAFLFIKGKWP